MRLYEGVFIFPPEATAEMRKNEEKTLEDVIKRNGGKIVQKIDLGRKPLGYNLKKFKEGYFIVIDMEVPRGKTIELRNMLELNESLLHFMVTVKNQKVAKAFDTKRGSPEERTSRVSHMASSKE
ncbi:MAG: 30S ribosomal protein S6 [Candidatus Omnitrophica bacterium]|nr:30S ribosomal protein S6 [Candidatus Omnitrophota bacterium]